MEKQKSSMHQLQSDVPNKTEKREDPPFKKALIIEDQEGPLEMLIAAISKTGVPFDVAKWYSQAEEMIRSGGYDIVFLDHRMPRNDPGCTDSEDFEKFCDQLENIGYNLAGLIREVLPGAAIVGTSSMSETGGDIDAKISKLDIMEKGYLDNILHEVSARMHLESRGAAH